MSLTVAQDPVSVLTIPRLDVCAGFLINCRMHTGQSRYSRYRCHLELLSSICDRKEKPHIAQGRRYLHRCPVANLMDRSIPGAT